MPGVGEFASVGVALLWAAGTLGYERYGADLDPVALNRFRTLVGTLLLAALCLAVSTGGWPRDGRTWLALTVSGLLSFGLSDTLFFAAMSRIGAQIAATSQSAVPVIVAVLAWAALGERLGMLQMVGLLLTLGAVTVIMLQGRPAASRGAVTAGGGGLLSAVLAAAAQALALVVARFGLASGVDPRAATLLRMAPSALLLGPLPRQLVVRPARSTALAAAAPAPFTPLLAPRVLGLLGAVLVGTVLSTMLQSYALQHTGAGICSVLGATYPLWMLPLGVPVGRPVERRVLLPTAGAVVGVGMILRRGARAPV